MDAIRLVCEDRSDRDALAAERALLLDRIAQMEIEATRCRTQAAQIEALRTLGAWDVDVASGALTWSEGIYRIFGLAPGEAVSVERALSFYPHEARAAISAGLAAATATGTPYDLTVPFTDVAGRSGWVRTIGQWQDTGGIQRIVGVIEDVTDEKASRDRLQDLVYLDALTGLPNRRAFEMHLAAIETEASLAPNAALLLVDIDHFKTVNDTYGHPAGDRLLQEIAARLRCCLGSGDMVARLGGDEFAVLLGDSSDADAPARKAAQILEDVRQPVQVGGDRLHPTASVGVSRLAFANGADGLLKCADVALYRAKALGRDRVQLFSPELRRRTDRDARILDAVRQGLGRNEFVAFYQPIVDLRTCQVRGLEALARWNHPERGVLPPSVFAAALEDPSLSVAIDDAVLRAALQQMREWVGDGVPVAAVNVNASEAQLRRPDLVERIVELLELNQLTPSRLKIELVETAYLGRDTQQIVTTVRRLAELGVVCALDDFGTGHASLTHLRQLRVNRVKIDRSFVANMCSEPFDRGLVKSLVELGRNLGIRMTAEGVETAEQMELLRSFGCDCAQGYLIGRPVPAAEVPDAVLRWYAACAAEGRTGAAERSAVAGARRRRSGR